MTVRSAVVVGAGIGGLAAAGGLAHAGWRVTLLERADRLRAEPTGLLLWPAGMRALEALWLGHGLEAVTTPVPDPGLRRPDGQRLAPPTPEPEPARLVHAEDLHDALVAGLGDRVEIHTGVPVRRALPDRPAVTDGRTTWTGDLVVAADGMDSTLRPAVSRRGTVVSAGATAWRAMIPWYRAPQLPAEYEAGGHTDGGGYRFYFATLGQRGAAGAGRRGGCYWRATVTGAPRPEPAATQLGLLRRWFHGWHAPIGELLAATEPEELVQRELRAVSPLPDRYAAPVGSGAVVLLGDAAHGMADQLGQGACLALEDAATLVASVRDATPGNPLRSAVEAYHATRRRRVTEVERKSRKLALTKRRGAGLARRRAQAAATATSWVPPGG